MPKLLRLIIVFALVWPHTSFAQATKRIKHGTAQTVCLSNTVSGSNKDGICVDATAGKAKAPNGWTSDAANLATSTDYGLIPRYVAPTSFTPTYGGGANISGTPTGSLTYMIIGGMAWIYGTPSVNCIAGSGTQTIFQFTLPAAIRSTNFTTSTQAVGSIYRFNQLLGGMVDSDSSGNKNLLVYFSCQSTGSQTYWLDIRAEAN